jgi:hypothetical protein
MAATTTLLDLVTPTQGTLSGTWGDTVNYGISDYVDIAIAGTLSFAGDGAITLVNTIGSASGNNIGATTAQYMVIRVTGTLTTPKIITAPSRSKLYLVDNAATGSTVSFIRSGQTPAVSIAVGEKAFVYYNGTDYVKVASSTATGDVVGPASATANGIALFNSTTGKLIKDSAASDGLIYGLTVGRGAGAVATNTAVGASALAANSSGANNTAVGVNALALNTTNNNTAIGRATLGLNTTGAANTAIGAAALFSNTTASSNVAVGRETLFSNTTGAANTAVGEGALLSNTTASNNTAVGLGALSSNTTASNNTAVGFQAGYTGSGAYFQFSTLVGYQAGYTSSPSSASSYGNTCIGAKSGYSLTTGYGNIIVGGIGSGGSDPAGNSLTTGINNTFIGPSSGNAITTGSKNTIIGKYDGNQGGLDIRTEANYIVLSDGDGNPRFYSNGSGVLYDQNGKLRAVPQSGSSKTTSYTLATTDVGEYILLGASGAIVIPDATFAAGDVITIFNNTASTATITCSITTAYIAGTFTDKATMTLAAAGVATVLFISGTLCVVSGNVT